MDRITESNEPHSQPVCTKKDMTTFEWQIAMGIRCAECEEYLVDCRCK
jgi:hypothetical protein